MLLQLQHALLNLTELVITEKICLNPYLNDQWQRIVWQFQLFGSFILKGCWSGNDILLKTTENSLNYKT